MTFESLKIVTYTMLKHPLIWALNLDMVLSMMALSEDKTLESISQGNLLFGHLLNTEGTPLLVPSPYINSYCSYDYFIAHWRLFFIFIW